MREFCEPKWKWVIYLAVEVSETDKPNVTNVYEVRTRELLALYRDPESDRRFR